MIALFTLFSITVITAWCGERRAAIFLFIAFLIATALMFNHHITDALDIQL